MQSNGRIGYLSNPAQKKRNVRAFWGYIYGRFSLYECKEIACPHRRVWTVCDLIRQRSRANAQSCWIRLHRRHIALVRQTGNGNFSWRKLGRRLASPPQQQQFHLCQWLPILWLWVPLCLPLWIRLLSLRRILPLPPLLRWWLLR